MAVVNKTIGTAARQYATITLWEAADGGGDGLGNDDCTGSCYDDSAFDESVTINFTALSIVLTVAVGERHDGTAGTGARIVRVSALPGLSITSANSSIAWLEVDANGNNYNGLVSFGLSANGNGDFHHLICHGHGTSSAWNHSCVGCSSWNQGNPSVFHNSIVYDVQSGKTSDNFGVNNAYDGFSLYNLTIHDVTNSSANDGQGITDSGGQIAAQEYKNIMVTDCDICYALGDPDPTEDYNLASDNTDSGANSIGADDGVVTANQYISTAPVNLHLKAGADAIGAGVDLNQTPAGVEFDIDNFDRHTAAVVWDMGADQYVAEGFARPKIHGSLAHGRTGLVA